MLTSWNSARERADRPSRLEQAGFGHEALVEIDAHCCATLRHNRPEWKSDRGRPPSSSSSVPQTSPMPTRGSSGNPPTVLRRRQAARREGRAQRVPRRRRDRRRRSARKAVMIENVRGFLDASSMTTRGSQAPAWPPRLRVRLAPVSTPRWTTSADIAQLRPRVIIVAVRQDLADGFEWPGEMHHNPPTVARRSTT